MMLRRRIMVPAGGATVDYVDLGLPSGLKWAKGNLVKNGSKYAIGEETDYGTYVSWGNIDGHNNGEGYDFSQTKYNNTPGKSVSADIPSSDAAHDICLARLGAPWRLPTAQNFQELYDNTDKEHTTINGVAGHKFMKKSDHSIYVFFPYSGYYDGTSNSGNIGGIGYYWSSSFYSSIVNSCMRIYTSGITPQSAEMRYYGCSIRPVCNQ